MGAGQRPADGQECTADRRKDVSVLPDHQNQHSRSVSLLPSLAVAALTTANALQEWGSSSGTHEKGQCKKHP
jgi:hypothetical protein